jgi:hypothetical protein
VWKLLPPRVVSSRAADSARGLAQWRVTLVLADGENADEAEKGRRFAAVLCHGVLGYLEPPDG